jgi:hypothetical protein
LVTNANCGNFTNIVTATGNSTCGSATNRATNVCVVTENPCIRVTKSCDTVVLGQGNTVSGVVSNCGNITLTGISVVDNLYGTLTNGITLAPGASANYSRLVTNANCGNFTNIVTATGNSTCGSATNRATNVCVVTENPCLRVTKSCDTVNIGQANLVSAAVTNCGNVTITNITVVDNIYGNVGTITSLAPGAVVTLTKSVTNTDCGNFTNVITASGTSRCGTPVQHQSTNVCVVIGCNPCIGVEKVIACYLGNNVCGTFGETATGVKGDLQDPAFCYRITITNCGLVTLTNVTVIDNQFGNLTTNFFNGVTPGTLAVGATRTYEYKAELGENTTNTVTAAGQSIANGAQVTTNDTAIAIVIPASIACQKIAFSADDTDGNANNSTVVLPGDGAAHTVIWSVVVFNTGQAGLTNVTISDPGCTTNIVIPSLAAGASVTSVLCQAEITSSCSNFVPGLLTNTVNVTASVDAGTNRYCALDINGTNITVRSECSATVSWPCEQGGCRQTGGGRQPGESTYTNPALDLGGTPRYVTHGGQVGAPVGRENSFDPDSDCIHGRLTHVRHIKGGLVGNFQARSFDSLMCACLGCPEDPGSGVSTNGLCNPGARICGPEPRKAPSNKIAFSGVGNYVLTNGRRVPRSVLFRVDIEDRSEPGGSHPGGAKAPADRYRIRIWVLTGTELAALNNPNNKLCGFRQAIAATSANVLIQDGAPGALGSAVFGVRAPDIDDGGELERGNHQLHPAIKPCTKPLHTCP